MPYLWTVELNIRPSFAYNQTIRVCGGEPDKANYVQVAGLWDVIDEQPKQPLGHTFCNELLSELQAIKISPVTPSVYGLDGTIYTLRFSSGFNEVEYRWWCDLPAEWSELQPIADRLLEFFKEPAK